MFALRILERLWTFPPVRGSPDPQHLERSEVLRVGRPAVRCPCTQGCRSFKMHLNSDSLRTHSGHSAGSYYDVLGTREFEFVAIMKTQIGKSPFVIALAVLALPVTFTLHIDTCRADVLGQNASPIAATEAPPVVQANTNSTAPKVVQQAQVKLPPTLAEVVRLAESGAEESVI